MLKLGIKYSESVLPNGLKILTAYSDIPVVDVELWTRTGYRYERPDELGYAHLLEHMLFTGTKKRPTPYSLNLEIEKRGGSFNASTSQNYVFYEMQMMQEDTEFMCDILSDIVLNSKIDPKRLENEKKVVLQELRQKQENHRDFFSRFNSKKVLPNHPMSNNILDTEQTTKNATSKKLREYLKRNYRPDQSALVMAGRIEHAQAVKLAKKYFGKWKKTNKPFDKCLREVKKAEKNSYFEKRDIKQTIFALNYYTNPLTNLQDSATWKMLSGFLSFGSTSILNRELREKRGLVYSVGTGRISYWDMGVFGISASTQKPEETLKVIRKIIKEIPKTLTAKEFEKVKKQGIASFVRYISKPGNQTSEMGEDFIVHNKLVSPEEWVKCMESVKRADVLELVKKNITNKTPILVSLGVKEIK